MVGRGEHYMVAAGDSDEIESKILANQLKRS